jgi:hypothetical protein
MAAVEIHHTAAGIGSEEACSYIERGGVQFGQEPALPSGSMPETQRVLRKAFSPETAPAVLGEKDASCGGVEIHMQSGDASGF